MQAVASKLKTFITHSPTPFHATKTVKERLLDAGFIELFESHSWTLESHKRYFVVRHDSSIIAFNYPDKERCLKGLHMVGAHTDSPALKIKPNPDISKAGVEQIGVEVYGGALLNPWFDRDLSIAGRVSFTDAHGVLTQELIDAKKAVAFIPSLAIHLDREANESKTVNAQKDLPAVMHLSSDEHFGDWLKSQISQEVTQILSFDLLLYDTQEGSVVGSDEALFASARLDNLLSCHAALEALLLADKDQASLFVFNDHEEIGSSSSQGAQGNFLASVLERMVGFDREAMSVMLAQSWFISTDNAHALHPNFSDLHEPNHAPLIGQGLAIKYNANQAYATESVGSAYFQTFVQKVQCQTQAYVVRSDTRCGSTIGPITATKLGIKTIDVGVPTWGMHSIREIAALSDVDDLIKILTAFYDRD